VPSALFFARLADCTRLYLPLRYVQVGFGKAAQSLHADEQVGLNTVMQAYAATEAKPSEEILEGEGANIDKVRMLGSKIEGNFVDLDAFLRHLVQQRAALRAKQTSKVRTLWRKYDEVGSGTLEAGQLTAMLKELKPSLTDMQAMQLEGACSLADGGLRRLETVEAMLDAGIELLHRRQQLSRGRSTYEAVRSEKEERKVDIELEQLARLWDTAKTMTTYFEETDFFVRNWYDVLKVQAGFRRLLVRIRVKHERPG